MLLCVCVGAASRPSPGHGSCYIPLAARAKWSQVTLSSLLVVLCLHFYKLVVVVLRLSSPSPPPGYVQPFFTHPAQGERCSALILRSKRRILTFLPIFHGTNLGRADRRSDVRLR